MARKSPRSVLAKRSPISLFPLPDGKFLLTVSDGISYVCNTKAELRRKLIRKVANEMADALIERVAKDIT